MKHTSTRAPCPPHPNPHFIPMPSSDPLTLGAQHGSPNLSSVGSSPYSWRLWLNQLPQPLQPQVTNEGTSVGTASGCSLCFLSSWLLGPVWPRLRAPQQGLASEALCSVDHLLNPHPEGTTTSACLITTPSSPRMVPGPSASLDTQLCLLLIVLPPGSGKLRSSSGPRPDEGIGSQGMTKKDGTHVLLTIWSRSPFLKDRSVSVRDS